MGGFFRLIFYLLLTIIGITLLRTIIGGIGKALFRSSPPPSQSPSTRAGGKLRKCVACGVYLPENEALPAKRDGVDEWFCSETCREAKSSAAS